MAADETLVVVITGPTAAGKSELACRLADHCAIEIINADSAQVYIGMDIGTAKPDTSTRARIPHHLLDIVSPDAVYNVQSFVDDVERIVAAVHRRGRLPVIVGGTMFYIHALLYGLSPLPLVSDAVRQQLRETLDEHGLATLYTELLRVDRPSAARIQRQDTQRILRALAVYYATGRPLSDWQQRPPRKPALAVQAVAILPERTTLRHRAAVRFDTMLAAGLVDEVRMLRTRWSLRADMPSMRTVGYRQVLAHLNGECDEATMRHNAVTATHQLIKRQTTWLRHRLPLPCFASIDAAFAACVQGIERIV